jgi:hypothetical protein
MRTIYIITGNPGHPIFYDSFIKLLRETTGYNIVINPLPGHTLETSDKRYTLRNIIRYHTKEIQKYKNVILIGPSMGCFVGLQVAKRVTNIDKFILLFPVIVHIAKTPEGEYTEKTQPLYKLIAPIADYFPKSLSNWLANSEHGHHVFHKQIILNCFALWEEEKFAITKPQRLPRNKEYLVIYSTKDGWTPPPIIRILKRMFPNTVETECNHAFGLNEDDCNLVSEYIANYIC